MEFSITRLIVGTNRAVDALTPFPSNASAWIARLTDRQRHRIRITNRTRRDPSPVSRTGSAPKGALTTERMRFRRKGGQWGSCAGTRPRGPFVPTVRRVWLRKAVCVGSSCGKAVELVGPRHSALPAQRAVAAAQRTLSARQDRACDELRSWIQGKIAGTVPAQTGDSFLPSVVLDYGRYGGGDLFDLCWRDSTDLPTESL